MQQINSERPLTEMTKRNMGTGQDFFKPKKRLPAKNSDQMRKGHNANLLPHQLLNKFERNSIGASPVKNLKKSPVQVEDDDDELEST